MGFQLLDCSAAVLGSCRVDNVEDAFFRDDQTVTKSLTFGCSERVSLAEPGIMWAGILTFVVAMKVADYIGVFRFTEDEGSIVVFSILLRHH